MNTVFWMLPAGIGMFLFGIYLMEESLKALSGSAFKRMIRRYTSSPLKAVASGTVSTAILQSSSAVTLMVLAFVGAGMMSLTNAFGVILGSNIGTTLTGWIVAVLGFKFNIESFALPFIGIGGLGLIFLGRTGKSANISKLMVGFGFLFLGLDYMQTGLEAVTGSVDLKEYAGYNVLFFVLIGFVITAVMQSSSAATAVILTALYSEVIDFYSASAMIVGANLGTTVTAMIGSIGGVITKKQVALGHVLINVVSGVVVLLLLKPANYLVLEIFGLRSDPLIALAAFHTLTKIVGLILFLPFVKTAADLIARVIKEEKVSNCRYISKATHEVPEAGIEAAEKEALYVVRLAMVHNLKLMNLDSRLVLSSDTDTDELSSRVAGYEQIYSRIKSVQSELFLFASKLQSQELEEADAVKLNKLLHAVRFGVSSAKTLKDVVHDLETMNQSDFKQIRERYRDFRKNMMQHYMVMDEVTAKKDSKVNLPRLIKLMLKLKEEDGLLMRELSRSFDIKGISDEEVSAVLSASRNFSLSARQISLAVKDLILSSEESDIYDTMEFTEDELKKLNTDHSEV